MTAHAYAPGTRHIIRYNPANPNDIRYNMDDTIVFFLTPILLGVFGLAADPYRFAVGVEGAVKAAAYRGQGRLTSMFRPKLSIVLFAILLGLDRVGSGATAKPNIVLVTLDSTRADRMGFLGSKAKLTPNLDNVARQSMVFEQAYSQAPLTVVSHATILSGTYPQTHRASEFGNRLAPTLPFVPDLLRARGYRTAAFVGSIALDPKNGFALGFDRGFAEYDAGFHQPEAEQSGHWLRSSAPAAQVVTRATAWLSRNPQGPFFLWVHLNDPQGCVRELRTMQRWPPLMQRWESW